MPHPQRRQFRPAQPAVAEHQDGGPAGPGGVGERFQLLGAFDFTAPPPIALEAMRAAAEPVG